MLLQREIIIEDERAILIFKDTDFYWRKYIGILLFTDIDCYKEDIDKEIILFK